jgi:putative SOS response-associated peptidase YedK
MCGRFVSASPSDEIAKYFSAEPAKEERLEPSFNVPPTTDVYAVMERAGVRLLDIVHWGLVPMWAKSLAVGNKMFNARAETLATKSAYRNAFKKRRCIIPADGFYEWKKVPGQKTKQPYFIRRADGERFAFAGLWELWRGPDKSDEEVLRSCTIITGRPNEKVAEIHDRMPVMLPPSVWDPWLDAEYNDTEALSKLLVPAPADLIELFPVSTLVNNARLKGPELAEPVASEAAGRPPADESGGQATLL